MRWFLAVILQSMWCHWWYAVCFAVILQCEDFFELRPASTFSPNDVLGEVGLLLVILSCFGHKQLGRAYGLGFTVFLELKHRFLLKATSVCLIPNQLQLIQPRLLRNWADAKGHSRSC
jgi:hypothetical protein